MTTTTKQSQYKYESSIGIRARRFLSRLGNVLILLIILFVVLVPILWLVQMSFRTQLAVFEMPPSLTEGWTLENYVKIAETPFFRHLFNSLLVSSLTTIFALAFGVPAAYAISRYRFRREALLTFWILVARLALPIGFALPLFNIFVRIGLVNTYPGIILAYLTFTVPLVIWIMRPFLDNIPTDMEEAAIVDGATNLQVFFRVIIPLSAPGLVSVGILTFIMTWIEFFYALIFTRGKMMTAPVSVVNFLRWEGWDWGQITTAGVIIMVPVILFSLFTHRYLISGLTAGAIKG
ncbi:MAG: carbohydrate ABC transporter permease [Anaerolineales bacterium]|nr:carbohydrate ABC transporter permease [Anaerolineales bacterium]